PAASPGGSVWGVGAEGRDRGGNPGGAGGGGGGGDADAADGEQLYRLLEEEVVPLFYTRDGRDVPTGWVEKMKHALCVAGQRFTARRMVRQYVTEHYVPAIKGQAPGDDPPTA